jgi:hypothetical protein
MHKVILMMLLAVISSSATAAWTKIGDAKDNTDGPNHGSFYSVYVDVGTMYNSNNSIKIWELYNYQTVQKGDGVNPYLSLKVRTEYDCSRERSREHYVAIFSENMGKGKRGGEKQYVQSWASVSVEPDTVGTRLWKFACGR